MGCCSLRPVAEACDRAAAEALRTQEGIPGMGDDVSKGEEIEAWVLEIESFYQTSAAQLYYGYSVQFSKIIYA